MKIDYMNEEACISYFAGRWQGESVNSLKIAMVLRIIVKNKPVLKGVLPFDWDEMYRVKLPVPSMEVKIAIAAIYHTLQARKRINEQLKDGIKPIRPFLMKRMRDGIILKKGRGGMKYNSQIHQRRSLRLKGYDYSRAGLYYITICCHQRICRFGFIENNAMQLNEYGKIAHIEWMKLAERFPNFELDVFQIMPNHMHGIIVLNQISAPVGAGVNPAPTTGADTQTHAKNDGQPHGIVPTISDIVGAYKSLVANGCLEIYKSKNETMGKLWQRNYYEHIIRNEQSYHQISEYIKKNPANWGKNKFHQQ